MSEQRLAEIEHEAPHVASREAMVLIRELVAMVRGLRARVAELTEALEATLETHDQGHSPCRCPEARAALQSKERES